MKIARKTVVASLCTLIVLLQSRAAAPSVLSTAASVPAALITRGLLAARSTNALSQYKHGVPNGNRIADKYFGHTASYLNGENPDFGGDNFGHNGYGRDYCAYDYEWNLRLCAADSDNDGQTNGLEMGDPCCGFSDFGSEFSTTGFTETSSDLGDPGNADLQSPLSPPLVCEDSWSDDCPDFDWLSPLVSGDGPHPGAEGLGVVSVGGTASEDNFIVFGLDVLDDGSSLPSTWSLTIDTSASTAVWELIDSASDSSDPAASVLGKFMAYAYDEPNGRIITFGGINQDGETTDAMGAFDTSDNTWSELDDGTSTPPPLFGASFGVIDRIFLVLGGRQTGGKSLSDVWGFDLASNSWSLLSTSAPASAINIFRDPAVVLGWSRQVIFSSSTLHQQWLWNFDDDTWERTVFGYVPHREAATVVGTYGAVYWIGGQAGEYDAPLDDEDTGLWVTSNTSIRESSTTPQLSRWEMRSTTSSTSSTSVGASFTSRIHSVAAHAIDSGAVVGSDGARILFMGGSTGTEDTGASATDLDSDGVIDVAVLVGALDQSASPCQFAVPGEGQDSNSSLGELVIRDYEASILLQDESNLFRVGLSWSILADGTGARFALRAPTDGYISLAFVHEDWPITTQSDYNGKMYGGDAVFGWFDDDGNGHVEVYGMPSYESDDIINDQKDESTYLNDASLYREDGYITLEFERTFDMASSSDVDIDPSGSWMMWCFADQGLFPDGAASGSTMIVHTERHEFFIEWDNTDQYTAEDDLADLLPTEAPVLCDELTSSNVESLGGSTGVQVGSCTGVADGDECVLACNYTSGFEPDTSSAVCSVQNDVASWYFDSSFQCEYLECRIEDLQEYLSRVNVADVVQLNDSAIDDGAFVYGENYSLRCAPGHNDSTSRIDIAVASCQGAVEVVDTDGSTFYVANWTISTDDIDAARSCEKITHFCPSTLAPDLDDNAVVNCTGQAIGDSCHIGCPEQGFFASSADTICQEAGGSSGIWSSFSISCAKVDDFCSSDVEEDVTYDNAQFEECSGVDASLGSLCEAHCDPGYEKVDNVSLTATCTESGEWSLTNSTACVMTVGLCRDSLLVAANGSSWVNKSECLTNSFVGSVCELRCNESDQSASTQCQSNGEWSQIENFNCDGVCSISLSNASLTGEECDGSSNSNIISGQNCSLETDVGFECYASDGTVLSDGIVVCGTDTFPVQCGLVEDFCSIEDIDGLTQNATSWECTSDLHTLGTSCSTQCAVGYTSNAGFTEFSADCTIDGWQLSNPIDCRHIAGYCSDVPDAFFATSTASQGVGAAGEGLVFGSGCFDAVISQACTVVCAPGYYSAEATMACASDGSWSPSLSLECEPVPDYCDMRDVEILADEMGLINHGTVSCFNADILLEGPGAPLSAECNVTCDNGYHAQPVLHSTTASAMSSSLTAPEVTRHGFSIADCVIDGQTEGQWTSHSRDAECVLEPNFCPMSPSTALINAEWSCDSSSRHLGDSCFSACLPGYDAPTNPLWGDAALASEFVSRAINAAAECDVSGQWVIDEAQVSNCTKVEELCSSRPPTTVGRVWVDCEGRAVGDSCSALCADGYLYVSLSDNDTNYDSATAANNFVAEKSFCDGESGEWTDVRHTCVLDLNFCPSFINETEVNFIEAGWHPTGVGLHTIACNASHVGAQCDIFCTDGYLPNSAVATCEISDDSTGIYAGTWNLPTLECLLPVDGSDLKVEGLSKYVTISGEGDRILGLSWDKLDGDDGHANGYIDIALRTRQTSGYLGIAFGEVEELMIPGDGVWGWIDANDDPHMIAYRMDSYLVSEIEQTPLEDSYIVDWTISIEDGLQTVRMVLRLDEPGSQGNWVPIRYNGVNHFQWALSDTEGVTMHTEWGALDLNFSINYGSDFVAQTEKHDELDSISAFLVVVLCALYMAFIVILGLLAFTMPATFLSCNHSCGQLRCCRNGSGNCWADGWARAARWPRCIRMLTFDGVLVALDWSFMVWLFYGATLAMLIAFFWVLQATGVEAARSTGWISIIAFALLLLPVSRDSFVLKLLRLPYDRAVAHHRALGRVFVICEVAHFSVVIRDWGWTVSGAHEVFGSGNVVPVWGWVSFALTTLGAILSIEWFRRRLFEVFYYSHLVMFFMSLWSTAVHVNVLPFLSLFEFDQELHKTSLDSFAGFYVGIGVPVLLYIIDRVQRGVVADGCCGSSGTYVVSHAAVHDSGDGEKIIHLIIQQPTDSKLTHPRIKYHAGQYCFLIFPQLSKLESHPYTISSAPPSRIARMTNQQCKNDRFSLGFHIKTLGDHTRALARLVERRKATPELIDVRIQGPYGAIRFNPFSYQKIILVAGGIGVTPLISLVEQMANDARHALVGVAASETGEQDSVSAWDAAPKSAAKEDKEGADSALRQEIVLLWSTRSLKEVMLFEDVLRDALDISSRNIAGTRVVISLRLFLTSGRSAAAKKKPKGSHITPVARTYEGSPINEGTAQEALDKPARAPRRSPANRANKGPASRYQHDRPQELQSTSPQRSDVLDEHVVNGRPNYNAEFDRFLRGNQDGDEKIVVDPNSCCVLACGPWQMIVDAQHAAYHRGFIFHKEVFDM